VYKRMRHRRLRGLRNATSNSMANGVYRYLADGGQRYRRGNGHHSLLQSFHLRRLSAAYAPQDGDGD
jgi:hypothetical protein